MLPVGKASLKHANSGALKSAAKTADRKFATISMYSKRKGKSLFK